MFSSVQSLSHCPPLNLIFPGFHPKCFFLPTPPTVFGWFHLPMASPLPPHWQLPDLHLEPSLFPRLQAHTSSCFPRGFTWTSHSTSHACTCLLLGQHSPHPHHSRPAPPPFTGPRPCSLLRPLIPNFSPVTTAYRLSFCKCFRIDQKPKKDLKRWIIYWPSTLGDKILKEIMFRKCFQLKWVIDLPEIYPLDQVWEERTRFLGSLSLLSRLATPSSLVSARTVSHLDYGKSPQWSPHLQPPQSWNWFSTLTTG